MLETEFPSHKYFARVKRSLSLGVSEGLECLKEEEEVKEASPQFLSL